MVCGYTQPCAVGVLFRARCADGIAVGLSGPVVLHVHEYKGDATHSIAVEKTKVHVSKVSSTVVSLSDLPTDADLGCIEQLALTSTTMCDILPVREGTGAETYALALKEIRVWSTTSVYGLD
jgi:hypothetical protein